MSMGTVAPDPGSRLTDEEKAVLRAALLWACVPNWGSYDDTHASLEDICEDLSRAVRRWTGKKHPRRIHDRTTRVLRTYYPKGSR